MSILYSILYSFAHLLRTLPTVYTERLHMANWSSLPLLLSTAPSSLSTLTSPLISLHSSYPAHSARRLHRAAAHGKLDIINILLEHNADTNAVDIQGKKETSAKLELQVVPTSDLCNAKDISQFLTLNITLGHTCKSLY